MSDTPQDEHGVPLPGMETPWTPEVKAALERVGRIMNARQAAREEVQECDREHDTLLIRRSSALEHEAQLGREEAEARAALDVALARQWALE